MVRQWLSGHPLEEFLSTDFGRAPRMGLATAWGAAPLLDWGVVSKLLRAGAPPRLGRAGSTWRGVLPRCMLEAHKRMREGWSLLISDAEKADEHLRRLADAVGGDLGHRVGVEVSASPKGAAGFGWRRHHEHLFLIQSCGTKTVHFRDHVQGSPRAWRLSPGDWLYLPDGWPHTCTVESDSLSIRLRARAYSPRSNRSFNETKVKPRERIASMVSSSLASPPSEAASWGCQKKDAQASRTTAVRRTDSPMSSGVS